jgi:hypothetical protein
MRDAGLTRTRTRKPMMIEIRAGDGRIVPTKQVSLTPSPGIAFGSSAIDVPCIAKYTNSVRVQVWRPGDCIPGIIDLLSLEVYLNP